MKKPKLSREQFVDQVLGKIQNSKDLQNELEKLVTEYNLIWDKDTAILGRILRAHLFIEHYMDQLLSSMLPSIENMEKLELEFSKKLEMVRGYSDLTEELYPGVKRLNAIRNRFVHNLSFKLDEAYAKPITENQILGLIDRTLSAQNISQTDIRLIEKIEKFAILAGMFFGISSDDNSFVNIVYNEMVNEISDSSDGELNKT